MIKTFTFLFLAALLGVNNIAHCQNNLSPDSYDGGASSSTDPATKQSTFTQLPTGSGVTFSQFSRGSGITAATGNNGYSSTGFNIGANNKFGNAVSSGDYVTHTISVAAGYELTISSFNYQFQRSNTGPSDVTLQYSTDGSTYTDIGTITGITGGSSPQPATFTPATPIVVGPSATITLRIVAYNASQSTGTFRVVNGTSFTATYGWPLPILLHAFQAAPAGHDVSLSWTASSTTEQGGFSIERSTDGRSFLPVGSVPANPLSTQYRYTDARLAQHAWYRLRMTDENGQVQYSQTIPVRGLDQSKDWVVTTTVRDRIQVQGSAGARYVLTTTDGRVVQQGISAQDAFSLQVDGLPQGLYLLRLADAASQQSYRIWKQ